MQKKLESGLKKLLRCLELTVAIIISIVLIFFLCREIVEIISNPDSLLKGSITHVLETMLSLVVAIEFVRLLLNPSSEHVIEVVVFALSRYIVVNHESPLETFVGVVCVAVLFAIQYFFLPRKEKEPAKHL